MINAEIDEVTSRPAAVKSIQKMRKIHPDIASWRVSGQYALPTPKRLSGTPRADRCH